LFFQSSHKPNAPNKPYKPPSKVKKEDSMNYPDFRHDEIVIIEDYRDYRIAIITDIDSESPRNAYDQFGLLTLPKYNLHEVEESKDVISRDINGDPFFTGTSFNEDSKIFLKYNPGVLLPVYMYSHGNDTVRTTPFSCQWDSNLAGYIFMPKSLILEEYYNSKTHKKHKIFTKKAREWAEQQLLHELKEYDDYITGNVYGYSISKLNPEYIPNPKDRSNPDNICNSTCSINEFSEERIEECWGFYGDPNSFLTQAKEVVDNLTQENN
jgi:hypothetical protein